MLLETSFRLISCFALFSQVSFVAHLSNLEVVWPS